MTKEITKAFILQQIQDKFRLRDLMPEKFTFSESVIPIYNVGPHLTEEAIESAIKSVTSGPTGLSFYSVPQTERWTLRNYNVVFMASGAYTVTGVFITRESSDHNKSMYLDMTLGQTVSYAINLPQPITLEPNDKIHVYIDSYTSTADLRLYINASVEEIR